MPCKNKGSKWLQDIKLGREIIAKDLKTYSRYAENAKRSFQNPVSTKKTML